MDNHYVESRYFKIRGGRTGTHTHWADESVWSDDTTAYSSKTVCGIWLRAQVTHFRIADDAVITCENCQRYNQDNLMARLAPRKGGKR